MDFLTHSLVGTGAARLICPDRKILPQLSLAAILGSEIMDGDAWLYLLGPNYYGFYHRVISHSVLGLTASALVAATMGWGAGGVKSWRRFGWFVTSNIPKENAVAPPLSRAPWRIHLAVASAGAALHFLGDVITGFGNMTPFWPWSHWDASLRAVYSFDVVIFPTTLAWHLLIRNLDLSRRREWPITLGYFVFVAAYVSIRMRAGEPAIW